MFLRSGGDMSPRFPEVFKRDKDTGLLGESPVCLFDPSVNPNLLGLWLFILRHLTSFYPWYLNASVL